VNLGRESRVIDQNAGVRDQAGRGASDVLIDLVDFFEARRFGQLWIRIRRSAIRTTPFA